MRLKKIKLAGFKSFVEPTSIPFPGEMTAIVGPNGCGKSNVIDAVRWVLGESSAKNLRGDAMTDVIFNGSSSRKPVGQCSVELVFDNSSGRIAGEFAGYNELAVKRLVTRDATSTYFLNGTKCRRRDVTDLFLGTGLGPRSYAIIEQGMISRLIESKPQELRVFIEEAAGISKYKERRRETENRIRHTVDNLDRLNDVREELGQQIEKLRRQAAAATRYKTLRASARELKGQLTALKFLKNSEHIETLQKQQQSQQQELDTLIAKQQGDEAGLHSYREQQNLLKVSIDEIQQKIFSLSTSITRIEQDTLHGQQRKKDINTELDGLSSQLQALLASMEEAEQALNVSNEQLELIEPELALKEAQLEQSKDNLEDAEESLRHYNTEAREREQTFHRLKQEVQQYHSKIQSIMSMQLRTTQRISELKEEQRSVSDDTLLMQIEEAQALKESAQEQYEMARQSLAESEEAERLAKASLEHVSQQYQSTNGELQGINSTLKALEALQQDASQNSKPLHDDLSLIWTHLGVPEEWAFATEVVLNHLHQPYMASSLTTPELADLNNQLPTGRPVFSAVSFTNVKQAGTLASVMTADNIPAFFNRIWLSENLDEAKQKVTSFSPQHQERSAITRQGEWFNSDWIVCGQESQGEGVLQRAAKIRELQAEQAVAEERLSHLHDEKALSTEMLDNASAVKNSVFKSSQDAQYAVQQASHSVGLLEHQLKQQTARLTNIEESLIKQEAQLEEEKEQLEILSETLEIQEAELMEHQELVESSLNQRTELEQKVANYRGIVENTTQENHTLALKCQQLENQRLLYQQQITRNQRQKDEYLARQTTLSKELEALNAPQASQQEQLQQLLEDKAIEEENRAELQIQQEEIGNLLRQTQSDHQIIAKDIQARSAQLEKLNIDIEGYRVRGTTILEQLEETKQSLRSVLDTLPENAEEDAWQQELDKVQAGLARLGAVNLAAVEEFEVQSERKNHLDTQHNDLSEALDTLQTAIRKIDKETRSRFSNTFEQVNEDLKNLFPKVFGGGSAYLALTDDDLLETGVTIMARPPGKKNSTIHLLSGGEKALTALSLVFAIFRLNPAPFCLLDEVDAPLDDANVGRFCKLVSEMSQTVQFIYITHNKIAMEMASHLTGVTMAEPGVSRMVAVDVDEAIAFAEA
ncbi:chromosome segregation protein SMC [Alteromonas sp. KUL49]|uniref:chromosome segregation protein SMC n=1 Tax=Alteromonas sp. KUL49 TaxID=2480798 RepID=UPI00102F0CB1|nr:chromosome segregation protein SMC [Alteromonas sp. KUL49]TAP35873.1 chromosome segregation protein SMC [Alteromonas sp. KUL49]GEA13256.1 chromosome partition protein Smc [Alteromonas sp. KUL49]